MRSGQPFDNEKLEHQTMYLLPAYAAEMPVERSFALCDRVDRLWRWITEQSPECARCRDDAEQALCEALVLGYARAPDPAAVIQKLAAPRASLFSRRAALHLAARYPLDEDVTAPCLPPPALQPLRASAAAMRALALLRKRAPALEDTPDLFAALLRQSGGALPHGVRLPTPRSAPFAALGDLLVQRELGALLAPWPAPSDEKPPLHAPFAVWERRVRGEAVPDAELSATGERLVAHAPIAVLCLLLERLLDRQGPLSETDEELVHDYLDQRTSANPVQLPPALLLRIARHPPFHRDLGRALAALDEDHLEPEALALREAARRAGEPALFTQVFARWIDALLAARADDKILRLHDPSLLRLAVQSTLAGGSVARALSLYRMATDHERAALILDELDRAPARSSPEMQAEVQAMRSWGSVDVEKAVRLEWLSARLDRWLAEVAPAQGP
jgi:hypothetical protein